MKIKVKEPNHYLTPKEKKTIFFLLCLANFGYCKKKKLTNEEIWTLFRNGHFSHIFYHFDLLVDEPWILILKIIMIPPPVKKVILPPSVWYPYRINRYDHDPYYSDDDPYYSDDDPYYSDDDPYYSDDVTRFGWCSLDTWSEFNYKHYTYDENVFYIETDDQKEINTELWRRKKARKDHTPKQRPKLKRVSGRKLKRKRKYILKNDAQRTSKKVTQTTRSP